MLERIYSHNLLKSLFILFISGILWPTNLSSQVQINEIMASNATVHADLDFGNFSDWIELYNNGDQELDLTGYYLSDDLTNLTMWSFQVGTILPAREFLLVYADGIGNGNILCCPIYFRR